MKGPAKSGGKVGDKDGKNGVRVKKKVKQKYKEEMEPKMKEMQMQRMRAKLWTWFMKVWNEKLSIFDGIFRLSF